MKLNGLVVSSVLAFLSMTAIAQESVTSAPPGGYDIVDLITRYSKRSGKAIIIDPRVRAQVVFAGLDPAKITHDQLLAILSVHQFAMVESGNVYLVVPDSNARQLPTPVFTDARFQASDHSIVTLVLTPKKTCVAVYVPVLRPFQPSSAHMAADMQTNTLVITDRANNVRRIVELVEQLDRRSEGKGDCGQFGGAAPAKKPAD